MCGNLNVRRLAASAALLLMVVLAPGSPAAAGEPSVHQQLDAGGTWSPVASSEVLGERAGALAVWTGSEVLVWGGGETPSTLTTGARFNPTTDAWSPLPKTPLLRHPQYAAAAVWTGTEMIVWDEYGRCAAGPDAAACRGGARFNPVTNTWRSIAPSGLSRRSAVSVVWTGREMLLWGGVRDCAAMPCAYGDGTAYDPVTDTWRPIAASRYVRPRAGHSAVWTGHEMLVWGGPPTATPRTSTMARPLTR